MMSPILVHGVSYGIMMLLWLLLYMVRFNWLCRRTPHTSRFSVFSNMRRSSQTNDSRIILGRVRTKAIGSFPQSTSYDQLLDLEWFWYLVGGLEHVYFPQPDWGWWSNLTFIFFRVVGQPPIRYNWRLLPYLWRTMKILLYLFFASHPNELVHQLHETSWSFTELVEWHMWKPNVR